MCVSLMGYEPIRPLLIYRFQPMCRVVTQVRCKCIVWGDGRGAKEKVSLLLPRTRNSFLNTLHAGKQKDSVIWPKNVTSSVYEKLI